MKRKVAVIGLAVTLSLVGAGIWLGTRSSPGDPILGSWEGINVVHASSTASVVSSRLRVNGDGTFQRFDSGVPAVKGSWKPVKAWENNQWSGVYTVSSRGPIDPRFYTEEEIGNDPALEESRRSGKLVPCASAYLFVEDPGLTHLVVPKKGGRSLESLYLHWIWHRPSIWPRWLTDGVDQLRQSASPSLSP